MFEKFKKEKVKKTEKKPKKDRKKRVKKGGNAIVSINRVTENSFVFFENEISVYEEKLKSKEFFVTYIQNKDILSASIEINRVTPENEITDAIIIKAYEDLALDPNDDYKITYIESPHSSGDSRFYNVFVVNNTLLRQNLSYIAENTKYIDYVAQAPFLMSALYKRNLISPTETDCFVYLQNDDAFLAIYQNGEYFESRPVRYNLKFIYDKFCELAGERVDEKEFYRQLSDGSIYLEDSKRLDYVIQIFDDMFFYLGDLLNSISKINNIKINNFYFSSDIGTISGIDAFVEERLSFKYKVFDFSIALNQKSIENLTQLDVLMMLLAQDYMLDKVDDYNYSPFLRPPPLAQRPVGKLISLSVLAFVAAMAYPSYQYVVGYQNQKLTEQKQIEFNEKDKKRSAISAKLADLEAKKEQKDKEIATQSEFLNKRSELLSAMHDKKVNYPMKSKAIYDISTLINKQEGTLYKIYNSDQNLTFTVRTDTEKKMTELLNDISKTKGYSVNTELIILDENNQTVAYESNVSVNMR